MDKLSRETRCLTELCDIRTEMGIAAVRPIVEIRRLPGESNCGALSGTTVPHLAWNKTPDAAATRTGIPACDRVDTRQQIRTNLHSTKRMATPIGTTKSCNGRAQI